jgi:hypothetical protein
MAKKKLAASKAKPTGAKPTAVTIRGSVEWRDWVERGADHCMLDVSKLFDIAVSQYLKEQGFGEARPKR